MHPTAKNYPFIHKPYTLCVRCVLRGEFLQWTHHLNPPIYPPQRQTISYLPSLQLTQNLLPLLCRHQAKAITAIEVHNFLILDPNHQIEHSITIHIG